jgi:hypothetical protein
VVTLGTWFTNIHHGSERQGLARHLEKATSWPVRDKHGTEVNHELRGKKRKRDTTGAAGTRRLPLPPLWVVRGGPTSCPWLGR